MIARRIPDGRTLMDREALSQWLETSEKALPLRGCFVRRDAVTQVSLFDAEMVQAAVLAALARAGGTALKRRGPRLRHADWRHA